MKRNFLLIMIRILSIHDYVTNAWFDRLKSRIPLKTSQKLLKDGLNAANGWITEWRSCPQKGILVWLAYGFEFWPTTLQMGTPQQSANSPGHSRSDCILHQTKWGMNPQNFLTLSSDLHMQVQILYNPLYPSN